MSSGNKKIACEESLTELQVEYLNETPGDWHAHESLKSK